jgi:hypothetical protein
MVHVLKMQGKSEIEQRMKLEIRHHELPVWGIVHKPVSVPEQIQPCSLSLLLRHNGFANSMLPTSHV